MCTVFEYLGNNVIIPAFYKNTLVRLHEFYQINAKDYNIKYKFHNISIDVCIYTLVNMTYFGICSCTLLVTSP